MNRYLYREYRTYFKRVPITKNIDSTYNYTNHDTIENKKRYIPIVEVFNKRKKMST